MTTANPPVTGKGTQQSVTAHARAAAGPLQLVAYYRVSTDRQGRSGLGLDAQRQKIHQLAAERRAVIVAEFVEIESGRKADRPQLALALAEARRFRAAVAVAKLDRLARDAELVLRLSREAEANGLRGFLFADLPDVYATTSAGRLILSVMAQAGASLRAMAAALNAAGVATASGGTSWSPVQVSRAIKRLELTQR
ncbi:recombinase family protein [Synechococcus sp. CS-1324]|uniref:recombinase family protein n=1 Tax=Synechococcus sp. CS-1324 TaxID=2847980 RepID=UPI000DB3FB5B|nr:recombinase family protein [Synechococcus sp. CS-1324]MCT0229897.1 recombinase family protein [Synechococcus sp. CS-1324]PZV06308.1 MAG: hypothetical protein DCF23_00540 [Cyanobium sp.]